MKFMKILTIGIALRPNIVTEDDTPLILLDETKKDGKPDKYIDEVTNTLHGKLT